MKFLLVIIFYGTTAWAGKCAFSGYFSRAGMAYCPVRASLLCVVYAENADKIKGCYLTWYKNGIYELPFERRMVESPDTIRIEVNCDKESVERLFFEMNRNNFLKFWAEHNMFDENAFNLVEQDLDNYPLSVFSKQFIKNKDFFDFY